MSNETRNENDIQYSICAYRDGYDFSSMTPEKQELTNQLYLGYDRISDLYDAYTTYDAIASGQAVQVLEERWGFPHSGEYAVCIFACERPRWSKNNEYILKLLVNDREIRLVKFKLSFFDPIYSEITTYFNARPGEAVDPRDIAGRLLYLKIENVLTQRGNAFSQIVNAMIPSQFEEEIIYEMIDLMIQQGTKEGG
ncbi:MAG: hypothetical protein J1E00_02430 [Oscillospiraceae bacterium]|nr:hypothetical protein [Oscillospiraceae bacterium]